MRPSARLRRRYQHSQDSHLGPTAEDFKSVFGLGSDEQHIGTVDEEGVLAVPNFRDFRFP